ncbi:nucleotidyl transferase AbiEii/AbiGii toxin family protein [Vibrio sp. SG41-7]|uniref:nucleotidyl transferase AbiEii/AbiGii toxin family protein n=1 Tax=Vibrio sp. SG41-7 TaxID=2760973 RepID=UPI001600675C|nr:nucleotidyl transferase AbiEii/AbiGii toxin family protein [Vibrio sp. SG41-7]MBB1463589.1 nucleotidyl transferase AbiEii/AbiGii toxin family protein [Vibrio sp. SG41-7]
MLKQKIDEILKRNPELAPVVEVIEKEILHHDILHVMTEHGALQRLTFIGGTSLRLCYNSSRLSEDLDFNGGHDFKPSMFDGLEDEIQSFLQKKHETPVYVNKPSPDKQGNTSSWKISIEKEPNRADLPRQKMHIDVCALPSFDLTNRVPINHYGIDTQTEGMLIRCQTMDEILADKFIALAYRARRIKPRDVWDIVWLNQRGIEVNNQLINNKLEARDKERDDFLIALGRQIKNLTENDAVKADFNSEMSRFVPQTLQAKTLDVPGYWDYVRETISRMGKRVSQPSSPTNKFDMSL